MGNAGGRPKKCFGDAVELASMRIAYRKEEGIKSGVKE